MTGKKLNRPAPAAESDMELPSNQRKRIKAKVLSWKSRLDAEATQVRQQVKRMPRALHSTVAPMLAEYDEAYTKAKNHESSSQVVAAYVGYVQATVNLSMVKHVSTFLENVVKGDFEAIHTHIQTLGAVNKQLDALQLDLEARSQRKTIGGQINAIAGFQSFVVARAFADQGDSAYNHAGKITEALAQGKLKPSAEVQKALLSNLLEPILYYAGADAMNTVAKDELDMVDEEGKPMQADLARLGKLAAAYGAASGAALGYFDSLVTEELASSKNMSKAEAQNVIVQIEPSYGLIFQASQIAEWVGEGRDKPKPELNVLRLAAGASAYIGSTSLTNKYYSLSASRNDQNEVVLGNRKALTNQLDLAKNSARSAATAANEAVGFIPASARLSYQLANAQREGDDEEKLQALENYWQSAFYSNLAFTIIGQKR